MSTTGESQPEILIPSLPNDIALQCLARVPRRYHPVLSAVSKPIRSLLSSPQFFAARSSLNCTEILPYLRIRTRTRKRIHGQNIDPSTWFTVYGNGRSNEDKSNFVIAPVPGTRLDRSPSSYYAALGPKIYILEDYLTKTLVWIFDCRFNTWEKGPRMPTKIRFPPNLVALDGKIYAMEWLPGLELSTYVLDTVAGHWESLPSPKLRDFEEPVRGYGISDGKVCVWLQEEEARFVPETRTWEVFRSRIGSGLPSYTEISEVNGVLYCLHSLGNRPELVEVNEDTLSSYVFKGFDDRIGEWKKLNLVNNRGLPNHLSCLSMVNAAGRLVVMGTAFFRDEFAKKMGMWYVEIEVNKDENGDFSGEVLWSKMVSSTARWFIDEERSHWVVKLHYSGHMYCNCMPVSL